MKEFTAAHAAMDELPDIGRPPKGNETMKRLNTSMIFALAGVIAASTGRADEITAATAGATQTESESGPDERVTVTDAVRAQKAAGLVFVPRNRGAPQVRLGGGTRSASHGDLPRVEALVPEQAGLTLSDQPVLYWYVSDKTKVRVDLVLLRQEPFELILEKTLPMAERMGVQRIRLADYDVHLELGVSYMWLVKLVPNAEDHSYDRVVGGGLERIRPDAGLAGRLEESRESRVQVLAGAGVWYDTVDEISTQIDAEPGNLALWNQRATLFEQVALPMIAMESGDAPGFQHR